MMKTIGIDIGGTRLKAGAVDHSGRILLTAAVETPGTLPAMREALAALLPGLLEGDTPGGVGIACKGQIEPGGTRVRNLPGILHYLEGRDLADLFDGLMAPGTCVRADNDARTAMAGEIAWGAARGLRNALMLTLGTGVGGAVLVEGQLLRGMHGAAGHLGHLVMDPDGASCICGNHGCLETVFSARAIEHAAIGAVMRGCDTRLTSVPKITCETVFTLAAENDEACVLIRDRAIAYLAAAISGLYCAFDPEALILGGQITEAGPALFEPLKEAVWLRTRHMLRRTVPLIRAQVSSGIQGAAALVIGGLAAEAR